MKLLQLIKDFRKWREEKYDNGIIEAVADVADKRYNPSTYDSENMAFCDGCVYGIKHRKEIFKKVKI